MFCTPAGFGVVNRHAGIEFRGSWFSNTYAWSLWEIDHPRKKYPAYNSHNYKHNDYRDDLEGYDYGKPWAKTWKNGEPSDTPTFDSIEDQIKNFMEEVDYAAKEHFSPDDCPVAWRDKTTDEYAPAEVKALALVIVELDGVEGLEDYLDALFSALSDEDEYAVGEM